MLSTLTVKIVTLNPSLAAASAASHPAWPAPITHISVSIILLFIYLPIQNLEKISLTTSSPVSIPIISPSLA